MPSRTAFEFDDYKAYLQALWEESEEKWGLLTRWAKAAGCHRPYFSRVINGPLHLTTDQAYALSNHFGMDERERSYFLKLLEHEKASTPEYRKFLKSTLASMRREYENISRRLAKDVVNTDQLGHAQYFAGWQWVALHVLVSIPDYHAPRMIAERLSLPLKAVEAMLKALESWGYVENVRGQWRWKSGHVHLPNHSPLISFHHGNWRTQAVLDSQIQSEESIHFTVVQSMSRETLAKLRQRLLDFIEEFSNEATPSPAEEIVCLTADLFIPFRKWGRQ